MENVGLLTAWLLAIVLGAVLAVSAVWWMWRKSSEPSLVERQEATITAQHARMDRMQHEIDELRQTVVVNQENYEEELGEFRNILDEWWHGMEKVFRQLDELKVVPVWRPQPLPPRKRIARRPSSALAGRIERQFNIDEMNNLAFDIGIHAEEIPGTTRHTRARELVELAHRRGITVALVGRVNELRSEEHHD